MLDLKFTLVSQSSLIFGIYPGVVCVFLFYQVRWKLLASKCSCSWSGLKRPSTLQSCHTAAQAKDCLCTVVNCWGQLALTQLLQDLSNPNKGSQLRKIECMYIWSIGSGKPSVNSCWFTCFRNPLMPILVGRARCDSWHGLEMECGFPSAWTPRWGSTMPTAINICRMSTLSLMSARC